MTTTYTPELLLPNPTPGDPAVANAWGTIENTGRTLVDSAVAGILNLSVAGNSNVILTSTAGSADQARNQHFVFSGVLTGNITIFWPQSLTRMFSVQNITSGQYTITLAVNNGSGSAAGSTYVIQQNAISQFISDGTNIVQRSTASGLNYIAPFTNAVTRTQSSKLSDVVSVRDFGAVLDGVTDDRSAIINAISYAVAAGHAILVDGIAYCSASIPITTNGVHIYGSMQDEGYQAPSGFTFASGQNGFVLCASTPGTTSQIFNFYLENLQITSGNHGVFCQDCVVDMKVRNVKITSTATAGSGAAAIRMKGFIQDHYFENFRSDGGDYSFYHDGTTGINGGSFSNSLWDKSVYYKCVGNGNYQNFINNQSSSSNGNIWIQPVVQFTNSTGVVLNGGSYWTFINLISEGVGFFTGSGTATAQTTGTLVSGSQTISVASTTNFVVGNTVTIQGGASGGSDYSTTISSIIPGVSITVAVAPANNLSGAIITNSLVDIMQIGGSNSCGQINVFGGSFNQYGTSRTPNSFNRYAINVVSTNSTVRVDGSFGNCDIGNQTQTVAIGPGTNLNLRSPGSTLDKFANSRFPNSLLTGVNLASARVNSPPGGNIEFDLLDSSLNSSGTFGVIQAFQSDTNRTRLFSFQTSESDIYSPILTMNNGSWGLYIRNSSPNGAISAPKGSIAVNQGGSAGSLLWVNTNGALAWSAFA